MNFFSDHKLQPAVQNISGLHGNIWKTATIILFILTMTIEVYGQCPNLDKGNTKISLNKSNKSISVSTTAEIDLSATRVMVYEFDEGVYYYDSRHLEKTKNIKEITVTVYSQEINVQGLPSGDFSIVVEKSGCKLQALGLGYSGFPNSAIRIE